MATRWSHPAGKRHLTVEQCVDRRNQDTGHEGSQRTRPRPDVFISLLTSEPGIAADPLTIVLRWGFAEC